MRGDWKDEAMQYRDIDRYAQQEAERQIAIERVRDNALDLLAALQWLHPRNGTWRTPDDATAQWIERAIAKATGQ